MGPPADADHNDRELLSAFYNYSEPFSCECRAFGRLQEAGHEELAVRCFGYMLLDEAHEQTMMTQFSDLKLDFNGDIYGPGGMDMRSRFLGKDGRAPPIRGIVKHFGQQNEETEEYLRAPLFRKILQDIKKIQQLGIIRLDVGTRQIIDDKFVDFSQAMTVPNFLMSPELNPHLTHKMKQVLEFETFKFSSNDYLQFDEMMYEWNLDHAEKHGRIPVSAFPNYDGSLIKYNIRSMTARERVYTFVDPRRYDWRTPPVSAGTSGEGQRRQLSSKPPLWIYRCHPKVAKYLGGSMVFSARIRWDYKEGFIYPRLDFHRIFQ
ncbi:kinetochore Sim4 complex subunit FTA2-domain-containing protein [Hypoxylon cercidicola]|nr:kinetochore Sim4 complex subunit FTA2-domain-containing protein [Hypoxylon cercidicola]